MASMMLSCSSPEIQSPASVPSIDADIRIMGSRDSIRCRSRGCFFMDSLCKVAKTYRKIATSQIAAQNAECWQQKLAIRRPIPCLIPARGFCASRNDAITQHVDRSGKRILQGFLDHSARVAVGIAGRVAPPFVKPSQTRHRVVGICGTFEISC